MNCSNKNEIKKDVKFIIDQLYLKCSNIINQGTINYKTSTTLNTCDEKSYRIYCTIVLIKPNSINNNSRIVGEYIVEKINSNNNGLICKFIIKATSSEDYREKYDIISEIITNDIIDYDKN